MDYNEIDWLRRHNGKYVVRQAGILVRRAFVTDDAARAWALRNYRTNNWKVERAMVRGADQ